MCRCYPWRGNKFNYTSKEGKKDGKTVRKWQRDGAKSPQSKMEEDGERKKER